MFTPRFSKVTNGPKCLSWITSLSSSSPPSLPNNSSPSSISILSNTWRPRSLVSAARHAIIFGGLAGAIIVSVFMKFATLGLEPTRNSLQPCLTTSQFNSNNAQPVVVNVEKLQRHLEKEYKRRKELIQRRDQDASQITAIRADMDSWLRLLRTTGESLMQSSTDNINHTDGVDNDDDDDDGGGGGRGRGRDRDDIAGAKLNLQYVPHKHVLNNDKDYADLAAKQGPIITERTLCREIDAKGQTCVFEGLTCLNTTAGKEGRPQVYIVDDRQVDGMEVAHDRWCHLRSVAADPRYYSSRHWPLLEDTVVPQQSCMEAVYRTSNSLLQNTSQKIKWIPSMALVDLDYAEISHNTHLAQDTLWVLDAKLWQKSLDHRPRPGYRSRRSHGDEDTMLLIPNTALYMPQTREQFEIQTGHDINRLMYAIILQKDATKLYDDLASRNELAAYSNISIPVPPRIVRRAAPILDTYPELERNGEMVFHGDLVKKTNTDLVCTARLTTGFKTGFTAGENVCREIRTRAYETMGIARPEVKKVGHIKYPQPPKSVLVLNRHTSREIGNGSELAEKLREKFEPMGVPVNYITTGDMFTSEQWVRTFSSAGVIVSPHGSHNMGMMFMHRHSAIIEIMPVGYTEFSFHLLAEPCKIWYFDMPSTIRPEQVESFNTTCGGYRPHLYSPCNMIKFEKVWVQVDALYDKILMAFERLGYDTNTWLNIVTSDGVRVPLEKQSQPSNRSTVSTTETTNTTTA